jgi:hypothetical protein
MKQARQRDERDANLYKVAELFRLRDYAVSYVSLTLLAVWVMVLIRIAFIILIDDRVALLAVTAMMCSLFLGWGIAALLSPINPTEEGRFSRLVSVLGGLVSGFTLAKAEQIISNLGFDASKASVSVGAAFFVLAPLSCFLTGLISAFIVRSVVVSKEQNRRDVDRRRLEEQEKSGPVPAEVSVRGVNAKETKQNTDV